MTRDDLARIIAAAIWRPQPCMSGDIWDRLGPLRKRDAEHAADAVLAEVPALTLPAGVGVGDGCVRGTDFPTVTITFPEGEYDARDAVVAMIQRMAEPGR